MSLHLPLLWLHPQFLSRSQSQNLKMRTGRTKLMLLTMLLCH
jgi:hypothetical protein